MYIIFLILLFGSPLFIILAHFFILRRVFKNNTDILLAKRTVFGYVFKQHFLMWVVVLILANIINNSGLDGLSGKQALLLFIVGAAFYAISGKYLLKIALPTTEKILKIHVVATVQLLIFTVLYAGITIAIGKSLPPFI